MPEDNDHLHTGSGAGGDRTTDPTQVNPPAPGSGSSNDATEQRWPAHDGGKNVPGESSVEQTMQISRVDPSDEDMRTAMRFAASTDRVPHEPPESESERTEVIPAVPPASGAPSPGTQQFAANTERFTPVSGQFTSSSEQFTPAAGGGAAGWQSGDGNIPPARPNDPFGSNSGGGENNRRGLIRTGVIAGVAVGVLALLYIGDLVFTSGTVPRGTVVADVQIGGMTETAAEKELRTKLSDSLEKPVRLQVGGVTKTTLNPKTAGLEMDWSATVQRAGSQPLNPFTRVGSLFSNREIAPVSNGDREQVTKAIEEAKPMLDQKPAEGTIRFEGAKPVAVDPVVGHDVDVAAATERVLTKWAALGPVQLPFDEQKVSTTHEGVQRALKEVAQPAVSGPVKVRGEGKEAQLAPEAIAQALRFEPDGEGGLKSAVDVPAAVAGVQPQLADTIRPGKDAEIVLEGGAPVVRPSTDGHGIDWDKSFEKLSEVLKKKNDRSVQAIYRQEPAKFTTDQANKLGIREVVSEFSTGGFEPASGVNIKRTAEQVNGAIIKPGETFSLNGHTGPRGVAQGYVESGIIKDGRPDKAVGGGISQFATTLYNASYFAGVKDVEHKEHSYYISRYPAGREATVFQNPDGSSVIDVKFKNTSDHGMMITAEWTPSKVTVKFWGTKQYEVSSQTGPQSAPTPPEVKVVPPDQACSPSTGQPGFTVHDTRTLKDVRSGKVTTEKPTKTVYDPHPIIHCNAPAGGAAAPR